MYYTELDGKHYELGTSGFLYRSDKLMYDHETQSLWNTLTGEPVVGPLVGQGIRLKRHHVVTTTWGQWKQDHPDTTVLTLNTGHNRDYGEGVAYASYFSHDQLMFKVPTTDARLQNKQEVLALILETAPDQPLAISADFLRENRIYHDQIGEISLVVLTDVAGANRVYECGDTKFVSFPDDNTVVDQSGNEWQIREEGLFRNETRLNRLPAHRAFWFGWRSMYEDTRLVK